MFNRLVFTLKVVRGENKIIAPSGDAVHLQFVQFTFATLNRCISHSSFVLHSTTTTTDWPVSWTHGSVFVYFAKWMHNEYGNFITEIAEL